MTVQEQGWLHLLDAPWANLVTTLAGQGFRAVVAGGAVRDILMGIPPQDVDILTNAPLVDIKRLFRPDHRVRLVGKSFPVCLVNGIEIASCRASGDFPQADLCTRDFTVNSMAMDPASGTLVDPCCGKKDLDQGVVRFTGDPVRRILEDPLRMVRASRFVSLLKGRLAGSALEAVRTYGHLVRDRVAGERIRLEILKAMAHETPSLFFRSLETSGLLRYILPCLNRLVRLDGGPFHGETVFEHCLLVGDALSPRRPLLRLAGFLHDCGKYDAVRLKDGSLTFPGHEAMRDAIARDLAALRFSTREKTYIDAMIQVHMRPLTVHTTPRAVRRILALLERTGITWQEFMRMRIADKGGNLAKPRYTLADIRNRAGKIKAELSRGRHPAFSTRDLAVTGREVMAVTGLSQGPHVGEAMTYLFEKVLEDPGLNTPDHLNRLARDWARNRGCSR